MKFLDTNILLRYLTGDDARKARACEALFERTERGQEALYTTVLVMAEVVWILMGKYRHSKASVVEAVRRLLNTRHLHTDEPDVLLMALQLFERHPIDFIDAYHGAIMLARGLTMVYSYDADFDRLPGIQRVEP